jgi:hypothetical protein
MQSAPAVKAARGRTRWRQGAWTPIPTAAGGGPAQSTAAPPTQQLGPATSRLRAMHIGDGACACLEGILVELAHAPLSGEMQELGQREEQHLVRRGQRGDHDLHVVDAPLLVAHSRDVDELLEQRVREYRLGQIAQELSQQGHLPAACAVCPVPVPERRASPPRHARRARTHSVREACGGRCTAGREVRACSGASSSIAGRSKWPFTQLQIQAARAPTDPPHKRTREGACVLRPPKTRLISARVEPIGRPSTSFARRCARIGQRTAWQRIESRRAAARSICLVASASPSARGSCNAPRNPSSGRDMAPTAPRHRAGLAVRRRPQCAMRLTRPSLR